MKANAIFLSVMGLLGFAVMVTPSAAFGQHDKVAWGKRIWEQKVDDEHKIVVDEKGIPHDDPQQGNVLWAPDYYWRLLKNGEGDGTLLFHNISNYSAGIGPKVLPIEVLYTDLYNGELVAVFNQGGRCWACQVHRKQDGSFVERPFPSPGDTLEQRPASVPPSLKTTGVLDTSVGPAMKSAEVMKQPDGMLLLRVTDDEKRSFRYQMRSREYSKHVIYYWEPVASSATKPTPATGPRDSTK